MIESKLYKNANLDSKKVIESTMQDSKDIIESNFTQNSQLQNLYKSIPKGRPFFKINIKSANANFDNTRDSVESKNAKDSKKNNVDVSHSLNMTKNIESRFYNKLDSIKNKIDCRNDKTNPFHHIKKEQVKWKF
ncbi:hypothetical protein DCO60_11680 [Helicobacter saguini]|nr:hypothetical protein [Helicobacter saguini]MWV71820.1 hypothetical protein [Helicobacter saguini]TLD95845.1 hypothetical protein LS64_000285 [Helicobacter saguini]